MDIDVHALQLLYQHLIQLLLRVQLHLHIGFGLFFGAQVPSRRGPVRIPTIQIYTIHIGFLFDDLVFSSHSLLGCNRLLKLALCKHGLMLLLLQIVVYLFQSGCIFCELLLIRP